MKRGVRLAAQVLLAILAATALLVGASLAALRTGWGAAFVKNQALPRVNAVIAGRLDVDQFKFDGDRVRLRGVMLRDPEGEIVARVGQLEIAFSPLQLLRGHVVIQRADVQSPSVFIKQDAAGLNLARAVASRHPRPASPPSPKPPSSSGGIDLDVGALRVSHGVFEFRSMPARAGEDVGMTVRLADIDAAGSSHLRRGADVFALAARLNAAVSEPLRGPLSIDVSGQGHGDHRELAIKFSVGAPGAESVLEATLRTDGPEQAEARLSRVQASPSLLRAFSPSVRLRVPVSLTGTVARAGADVRMSSTITGATAGQIGVHASANVTERKLRELSITATNIDLGALWDGLPRSSLSLTIDGAGQLASPSWDPRAVSGTLAFKMPAGLVNGVAVGPAAVGVVATDGHYALRELNLALPGLVVSGQGDAGPRRVSVRTTLIASDLARTARTLSSFPPLRGLPPVTGKGQVDIGLSGTVTAPGMRATGTFSRLSVGQDSVAGLQLAADIPDLHVPQISRIDLRAARARIGGRAWDGIVIHAQSNPHHIALNVHAGGAVPLAVDGAGTWGDHWDWFALEKFELRYPGAHWRLSHPTRMTLGPDRLGFDNLILRSREQRIHAGIDKRGERIRGNLVLEQVDLGALPPSLLPAGVVLGGRLDVQAAIGGKIGRPTGRAQIALRDGRFGRYRNLGLRLDGRYDGRRAIGDVDAQGLGTSLHARFDLPTAWAPRDRGAPLNLDLAVAEVELSALREAFNLDVAPGVSGGVALSLQLDGTEHELALRLAATGKRLVVAHQAVGDVALHVTADHKTPLTAALEIRTPKQSALDPRTPSLLGCEGTFNVKTDLALASLTHGIPATSTLMQTHFDVSGDLRGIPLGVMARLAQSPAVSGGTASVRVSATGTPAAPTGALNIQVAAASGPRFPATDGRLDAAFGKKDTRVALRVIRGGQGLFSASGILDLPSRRLADRAALVSAPLQLTAAVGPLRFLRNELPESATLGIPQALTGSAGAALVLNGTLERPTLKVTADLYDARLGNRSVGNAHALISYAAQRTDADIRFHTAAGGELRVTGKADVDLSYPKVVRGVNVNQIPIEAAFTARGFELAWLSGFSQDVRTVGGQLTAAITARGRVGNPGVKGQLEWTNGALTLTGLGSYRNIHLKAHGDQRSYWIDELSLASGEGTARLTANASLSGNQQYKVVSSLSLRRFPAYSQGQALAILSIDNNLTGTASPEGIQASVKISEAHIELTDAKQKKPQPLKMPADVIFMEGDQPVDRVAAAKLATLATSLGMDATARAAMRKTAPPPPVAKPFLTQITVDAPRNLWVKGKDAALELGLEPDFRVEASGPLRINGRVLVKRGRIDVFGRRFDLQAGSVIRFNGSQDAPRLDVIAKHTNEAEGITVTLTAKGPLDHLKVSVSSADRPELTEGQLYTLIVTGHLQLGGNSAGSASPSDQAASLVGGLVAAQLQKTLAKRLPLDVLTLQAGEGLSGSRLEAGTYLTSKLYAGYVGRVGANPALYQNSNAVHLEYELSRRWSFDGEYGDVGTGTADVIWTKNY